MHEDGWSRGNIYGCYTHGIFDRAEIAGTIVNALRKQKGMYPLDLEAFDYQAYREGQYNHLADVLRRHLDMEKIYLILEGEKKQEIKNHSANESLFIEDLLPGEIEARSFAQIDQELHERGLVLLPGTEEIVKRAIHTTADFDYAKNLYFSPGAVEKAFEALARGAVIVTDTNMAKSGINKAKAAAHALWRMRM